MKEDEEEGMQVFKWTQSGTTFQPDPAASIFTCPDNQKRRDAYRTVGSLCGSALWNGQTIGATPSLFFCRRVLAHMRSVRLRVVEPRPSLSIGDKCVWPLSFLAYAWGEGGTTFAVRRVPPPLELRAVAVQKSEEKTKEEKTTEEKTKEEGSDDGDDKDTETKSMERAVDEFPLLHAGTHGQYRHPNEEGELEDVDDIHRDVAGRCPLTCELAPWIARHLDLHVGDLVDVERVILPTASHLQLDVGRNLSSEEMEEARLVLQQELSIHYDTLSEGVSIPVRWKGDIVDVHVVRVFTDDGRWGDMRPLALEQPSHQHYQVDAVNIRRGGVIRNLSFDFVRSKKSGLCIFTEEEAKADEKADEDGGGGAAAAAMGYDLPYENPNETPRNALRRLAVGTQFERGSSARRFLERVEDYLEQADTTTPWLEMFVDILEGRKDLFHLDDYDCRGIDLLSREAGVPDEPKMWKQVSVPRDDVLAGKQVAYPMVPLRDMESVDGKNKVRYLDLWLRHKLESEIDEGTRWFVQGLTSVVPAGAVCMVRGGVFFIFFWLK